MRKKIPGLAVVLLVMLLIIPFVVMAEEEYYARCNLKIIKGIMGNKITWVNYQSAKDNIPAGTKLKVSVSGDTATLTDHSGATYKLDMGASGDQYLEKFVTRKPVDIEKASDKFAADIKEGVPRQGMTKEQVYIAMGPPPYVDSKNRSDKYTYDDTIKGNLWVYRRVRVGKTIGVEFDANGIVWRTEGTAVAYAPVPTGDYTPKPVVKEYIPKPVIKETVVEDIRTIPDFKAIKRDNDMAVIIGIENYQGGSKIRLFKERCRAGKGLSQGARFSGEEHRIHY